MSRKSKLPADYLTADGLGICDGRRLTSTTGLLSIRATFLGQNLTSAGAASAKASTAGHRGRPDWLKLAVAAAAPCGRKALSKMETARLNGEMAYHALRGDLYACAHQTPCMPLGTIRQAVEKPCGWRRQL